MSDTAEEWAYQVPLKPGPGTRRAVGDQLVPGFFVSLYFPHAMHVQELPTRLLYTAREVPAVYHRQLGHQFPACV